MSDRSDEPTKPLPEELGGGPADVPTEPMVAPHVPIADAPTAPLEPGGTPPVPRKRFPSWAWLVIVLLVVIAAALAAVFAGTLLDQGDRPLPTDTPSTSPSVTPEAPTEQPVEPPSEEPAPPPAPEPTQPPPEPTEPPDPEPTPTSS